MKKLLGVMVLAIAFVMGSRAADDKPKYTIDEVMEKAHKGGKDSLRGKVLSGKADKDEVASLLEMYESLAKNDPPKGDKAAWKKLNAQIVMTTKKLVAKPDDAASLRALNQATACAKCHNQFKGE